MKKGPYKNIVASFSSGDRTRLRLTQVIYTGSLLYSFPSNAGVMVCPYLKARDSPKYVPSTVYKDYEVQDGTVVLTAVESRLAVSQLTKMTESHLFNFRLEAAWQLSRFIPFVGLSRLNVEAAITTLHSIPSLEALPSMSLLSKHLT